MVALVLREQSDARRKAKGVPEVPETERPAQPGGRLPFPGGVYRLLELGRARLVDRRRPRAADVALAFGEVAFFQSSIVTLGRSFGKRRPLAAGDPWSDGSC